MVAVLHLQQTRAGGLAILSSRENQPSSEDETMIDQTSLQQYAIVMNYLAQEKRAPAAR